MRAGRERIRWDSDKRTEDAAGMAFIGRSSSGWTGAYGHTKARHGARPG